jgi:hypothetical protein
MQLPQCAPHAGARGGARRAARAAGSPGTATIIFFKTLHTDLYDDSHSEQKVSVNVPILLYKFFSTNQYINLVLLDDPGGVRTHITRVVLQIQWLDFGCNLVLKRKPIIGSPTDLGTKPL